MIDTNQYTKTHELYTQFGQWLGVDGKVDSNYFMINYSLHAAERYIKNYYNVDLQIGTVFEKVSKNYEFSTTSLPTKILNIFKAGNISYPVVTYLDTNNTSLITSDGDYTLDMDLFQSVDTFYGTYLTGYLYTDTTDYSDIDFEDEYRLPSPRIIIGSSTAVRSPQEVFSNELILKVIGTPFSELLVNGTSVGTLSDTGEYDYQYSLVQEVTTFSFKLVDVNDGKESLEVKELFVLSSKIPTPVLHVLGYEQRVNKKEVIVLVATRVGSTITYGDVDVVTVGPVTELVIPINTDSSFATVMLSIQSSLYGKASKPINIVIEYSASLSDSYLYELNKNVRYIPYIPEDLLIAVFKLANHFYTGTLYNNSNVDSFRTANDISQAYTSHSIPSDVKSLLSAYTYYNK